jgi:hypothetical protein
MFGEQYNSNANLRISIQKIELTLFKQAKIKGMYFDVREGTEYMEKYSLVLNESNGYNDWNNDDAFLINWIFKQIAGDGVYLLKDGEPVISTISPNVATNTQQQTANISSAQSVHNDNDVAKINDLETQLATLQGKMASMLQIMISKGLV